MTKKFGPVSLLMLVFALSSNPGWAEILVEIQGYKVHAFDNWCGPEAQLVLEKERTKRWDNSTFDAKMIDPLIPRIRDVVSEKCAAAEVLLFDTGERLFRNRVPEITRRYYRASSETNWKVRDRFLLEADLLCPLRVEPKHPEDKFLDQLRNIESTPEAAKRRAAVGYFPPSVMSKITPIIISPYSDMYIGFGGEAVTDLASLNGGTLYKQIAFALNINPDALNFNDLSDIAAALLLIDARHFYRGEIDTVSEAVASGLYVPTIDDFQLAGLSTPLPSESMIQEFLASGCNGSVYSYSSAMGGSREAMLDLQMYQISGYGNSDKAGERARTKAWQDQRAQTILQRIKDYSQKPLKQILDEDSDKRASWQYDVMDELREKTRLQRFGSHNSIELAYYQGEGLLAKMGLKAREYESLSDLENALILEDPKSLDNILFEFERYASSRSVWEGLTFSRFIAGTRQRDTMQLEMRRKNFAFELSPSTASSEYYAQIEEDLALKAEAARRQALDETVANAWQVKDEFTWLGAPAIFFRLMHAGEYEALRHIASRQSRAPNGIDLEWGKVQRRMIEHDYSWGYYIYIYARTLAEDFGSCELTPFSLTINKTHVWRTTNAWGHTLNESSMRGRDEIRPIPLEFYEIGREYWDHSVIGMNSSFWNNIERMIGRHGCGSELVTTLNKNMEIYADNYHARECAICGFTR